MKQITLRSIPDEIEAMVKREAKAKGLSLNKAFITLMERAGGIKAKDKKRRRFITIWTICPVYGQKVIPQSLITIFSYSEKWMRNYGEKQDNHGYICLFLPPERKP